MASFDDVVTRYRVRGVELTAWIEQRWVRPARTADGFEFDDVDQARVSLIRELRRDMMLDDEAMGLVLSLMDQLYAARRMLKSVEHAVEALPPETQAEIRVLLGRAPER